MASRNHRDGFQAIGVTVYLFTLHFFRQVLWPATVSRCKTEGSGAGSDLRLSSFRSDQDGGSIGCSLHSATLFVARKFGRMRVQASSESCCHCAVQGEGMLNIGFESFVSWRHLKQFTAIDFLDDCESDLYGCSTRSDYFRTAPDCVIAAR